MHTQGYLMYVLVCVVLLSIRHCKKQFLLDLCTYVCMYVPHPQTGTGLRKTCMLYFIYTNPYKCPNHAATLAASVAQEEEPTLPVARMWNHLADPCTVHTPHSLT